MAASAAFQSLKKQIADNKLSKVYLFFGEEVFLLDLNIEKIKALVPDMDFPDFNRLELDGKSAQLTEIADALDGYPMMAERRLVIINDSGAFKAKLSAEIKDFYTDRIKKSTDDTVLIFREAEVDKRSAVYKAAAKYGMAVEFEKLSDSDLASWVIREATATGKKITRSNAELLVGISDRSIETLKNEIQKLAAYAEEEISAPIINKLASRSLEANIFDLCELIVSGDSDGAISMLEALRTNKASAFSVLYLLYSSFEKALKAQLLLSRSEPQETIASALSVPRFAVSKYIKISKALPEKKLTSLIMMIPELDLAVKRGETEQWQAVERLVFAGLGKE